VAGLRLDPLGKMLPQTQSTRRRPIVGAEPPLFLQVYATDDKLAPVALDIVAAPASQTFDESILSV